jgi:hypothetical protein
MRKLFIALLGSSMLLIAFPALAVCPEAIGEWSSPETMLCGRASEAYCPPNTGAGQPGNMQNAMSYDMGTGQLGTQWKVWGMTLATVQGPFPAGANAVTYISTYDGGQYWLDGNYLATMGGWGNGVDLTGSVYDYVVVTTVTLDEFGNPLGKTSNVTFNADFDDCPELNNCVIEYAIGNSTDVGEGTGIPSDYPPFLCGTAGEWFDVCGIRMSFNCAVPSEEATWGALKSDYR